MQCSYARGRGKARTLRFKQDSGVGGAKYDWSPVSKVNFPIRTYTNWNGNAKLLRAHATYGFWPGGPRCSSYNTSVTHVENSPGSFGIFIRSTLVWGFVLFHPQSTSYRYHWGAGRVPSSGAKNASLALPVSQTHSLWAPLWMMSPPWPTLRRNSQSPVNLAVAITGQARGAGSVKQWDPTNAGQAPILVPVCHGAGELNQPHKAERELVPIMANRRTFVLLSSNTSRHKHDASAVRTRKPMYFDVCLSCLAWLPKRAHRKLITTLCISGMNPLHIQSKQSPKICTYMLYLPTVPSEGAWWFIMMIDHSSLS